ncbi:MAG: hypothetical protein ABI633_00725 [Burkholderiales bacterium]
MHDDEIGAIGVGVKAFEQAPKRFDTARRGADRDTEEGMTKRARDVLGGECVVQLDAADGVVWAGVEKVVQLSPVPVKVECSR